MSNPLTAAEHATRDPRRAAVPLLAVLGLLLGASGALAQSSGAVVGQVVDKTGQPFAFVDVFLERDDGQFQDDTLADEDGRFRFSPVRPGTYTLYAYSAGFESTRFSQIKVTPGRTQSFTVTLRPADEQVEELEVNAAILGLVDTRRTDVSTTLEGEFIDAIPLQNKRIQDIVALFAGVTRNGSSDSSDISVAGGSSGQVGYRLNGISINDPVDGGAILDISTGAIQDFKLITGGFQAKYGEQSTGIAEIVTKSGTNEVSWDYEVSFRDSDYGAQSIPDLDDVAEFWDDLLTGRGSLLQSEIAQGFQLLGVETTSTTDDDSNPTPRHRVRHTISAGGPIKKDRVFFHVTVESLSDDFGNPFAEGTNYQDQILMNAKIDWQVSDENKLVITTDVDAQENTGFTSVNAIKSVDESNTRGTWNLSAVDTHIISDRTFLESRFQVLHNYTTTRPVDPRSGVGPQYQIPMPPGGFVSYFTGNANTNFDQSTFSIRAETSLSHTMGGRDQHDLEFGISVQTTDFKSYVDSGPTVTDLRITDDRGFLGGVPDLVGRELNFGPALRTDDSTWQTNLYVQDTWRVTDNLTLDLGLRGDYQDFVANFFLQPRIGFSLDPIGDGTTRFFGNWGIYQDNIFTNALQHAAQPDRLFSDINFAGAFQQNREFRATSIATIYEEALKTPLANRFDRDAVAYLMPLTRDRYVLADDLTAPTSKGFLVGIERRLPANMRIQVSYREDKRSHQLRTITVTRRLQQFLGDRILRDLILQSSGEGNYRQWSVELQRPFSQNWQANFSYTQSRNSGPLSQSSTPIDPFDVAPENGLLGNDRTHVVKLQGRARLPWKVDLSADFTWQTGQPLTATIVQSDGTTFRPLGRNTLRLPSSRQLNFGLKRSFQTADDKITVSGELQVFNLLNELNVFSGLGRFQVPEGTADPQRYPPLRPTIIPLGIDVSRSVELGLKVSF